MKFTTTRQDLLKGVKNVLPALGHGMVPIFNTIRLSTTSVGLELVAMDGALTLKSVVPANLQADGAVCVNGKAFADVSAKLQDEKISVSIIENRLQIKTARSAIHLTTLDASDFPAPTDYLNMQYARLDDFFSLVDLVSFAASKEEDRGALRGVFYTAGEMVALDGHRMVRKAHQHPIADGVILPANSLSQLRRVFTEPTLGVALENTQIHFRSENKMGSLRFLQGPYPGYAAVMPSGPKQTAVVGKADLLGALELVSTVTDSEQLVVLAFKETLVVTAQSAERGTAEDELNCQYDGTGFRVGLSAHYLKQAVEKFSGEQVTFELRDSKKPIVLIEEGYVHVIMPKRLH